MHEHDVQLVLQTVAIALSVGVLLIAVAKRLGAPSILLLLAGGVALGPMGLAVVQPHSLGDGLRVIVSLLVGVILFEGGLTLDLAGYRRGSRVIKLLLTVGAAVTWLGTAAALWALTGFGFAHCVVIASLVIVTGPTVIGPLLKRVRVNERLHHILQWEGVLIDPVGVFIAVLCFEALALGRGGDALLDFALRIGTGLGLGVVGGIDHPAAAGDLLADLEEIALLAIHGRDALLEHGDAADTHLGLSDNQLRRPRMVSITVLPVSMTLALAW